MNFNICRGEFVQILNVGRNHWITVSSKGEGIEQLDVIDIMYHNVSVGFPSGNISTRTKEQIVSICFCEKKEIHVTICDVQKQQGGKDCGLFCDSLWWPKSFRNELHSVSSMRTSHQLFRK